MASYYKNRGSYVVKFRNAAGKLDYVYGLKSKKLAEQACAAKSTEEQLRKSGLLKVDAAVEAMRVYAAMPLDQHLADWRQSILDKKRLPKHANEMVWHVRRLCRLAKIVSIDRIDAGSIQGAARRLMDDLGKAPRTANAAITAARMFSRWLKRTGRRADHPLEFMERFNEQLDQRRRRRAMTLEEFSELVRHTPANTDRNRTGVSSLDLAMLYQVAVWTGFRQRALRHLEKRDFVVDERTDRPHVHLAAKFNKKGKPRIQPIRADQAAALRQWLAGKPETGPVWPLRPHVDLAIRFRSDLAFARGQWIEAAGTDTAERKRREASDFLVYRDRNGAFADFHGLRHTGITLVTAHSSLKAAQVWADHSTPVLTAKYAHQTLDDEQRALAALPGAATPGAATAQNASTAPSGAPAQESPAVAGGDQDKAQRRTARKPGRRAGERSSSTAKRAARVAGAAGKRPKTVHAAQLPSGPDNAGESRANTDAKPRRKPGRKAGRKTG